MILNLEKNKDWVNLAKAYYNLGVEAQENNDFYKAYMWFMRATNIYSENDDIYKAFGEELANKCSEYVSELYNNNLFYEKIYQGDIERKSEQLSNVKLQVMGMFSIARLVKLFNELSKFPNCEVLGKIDNALDIVLETTFAGRSTHKLYEELVSLGPKLYELVCSPDYWLTSNSIEVKNGKPFQIYDLNSGVIPEVFAYFDEHTKFLVAKSNGTEPDRGVDDILSTTILIDYFVRTSDTTDIHNIPAIKAELERINSDFKFLEGELEIGAIYRRLKAYKNIDIFDTEVLPSEDIYMPDLYEKKESIIIAESIDSYYGNFDKVLPDTKSYDIHCNIAFVNPNEQNNFYTLVTMGMGAHEMKVPEKILEHSNNRAELVIQLPENWNIEHFEDYNNYWPINMLKTIARLPINQFEWVGHGRIVPLSRPVSDNCKFVGMLLIKDDLVVDLGDKKKVDFYKVAPVYEEEINYRLEYGADALIDLFIENDIDPTLIDLKRKNACDKELYH